MSEEEIIEILTDIINDEASIIDEIDYKAIQGLLDLYKAEKEENKKLKNCHLRYEEITGIDLLLED